MSENLQENLQHFNRVNSQEAEQLIQEKNGAVVFVGRESCPYCRLFIPKLAELAVTKNVNIHYLNSEDQADAEGISAFRQKYQVPTVPGLVYADDQGSRTVCDSSLSIQEIAEFVKA